LADIEVPESKAGLLANAEEQVNTILKNFKRGLISDEERYNETIKVWAKVTEDIQTAIMNSPNKMNPINMMANTGARGNPTQIRQLSGMRGLMADTSGKTIELPIKSCFKDGLDVLEFFISSHGARKGLADTALRTADSGYLTRRLVDVNQDVIVMEDDCGTDKGLDVEAILESGEPIEKLQERLEGRFIAQDILDSEGKVLYPRNTYVTDDIAKIIVDTGIQKVKIRSALTCESIRGICTKCYGKNLATGDVISPGEAIGIISAQSIGEPGTQLTMRTFHSGGVAGDDITQGLPRVEELFEARKPKGVAMVSEIDGIVTIGEHGNNKEVVVTRESDKHTERYLIPYGIRICVMNGSVVKAGDRITVGSLDPHDIIRIKGDVAVQNYLIEEVQKVYRTQGVHIDDKHIEIVARQMLRKIYIEEAGDTNLIAGSTIDMNEFNAENKRVLQEDKRPAKGKKTLLGITKIALLTESFLSAASFQETARVLTDAAIRGKVDKLQGLKENVIIGRLIPAGTGVVDYSSIEVDSEESLHHKDLSCVDTVADVQEDSSEDLDESEED
jgi:DNA-directed RNA polymerase subunit beta'